jgi:predicted transcriptional regulator
MVAHVPPIESGPGPPPPADGGASILAGISLVAVLAVGLFASTSRGGTALSAAVLVPLFTRLRKEEVRNQYNRGRMIQFIEDHPGASFTDVRGRLGLSHGACAYHLRVLERNLEVRRVVHGASARYYPYRFRVDPEGLPPLTDLQHKILEVVVSVGSATYGQLAEEVARRGVEVTDKNLAYHLRTLARKRGLISVRRDGKNATYFVEEDRRERIRERLAAELRQEGLDGESEPREVAQKRGAQMTEPAAAGPGDLPP